jgi:hypothetical protein
MNESINLFFLEGSTMPVDSCPALPAGSLQAGEKRACLVFKAQRTNFEAAHIEALARTVHS